LRALKIGRIPDRRRGFDLEACKKNSKQCARSTAADVRLGRSIRRQYLAAAGPAKANKEWSMPTIAVLGLSIKRATVLAGRRLRYATLACALGLEAGNARLLLLALPRLRDPQAGDHRHNDQYRGDDDCRNYRPIASWRGVAMPTRVRHRFRSYCRRMGRVIVVVLGVVVALFGLLFALQGFGMVGGSPMSNTTTWSVLGPIIALVGIAIAVGAARRRK
jgi:hypothetical protein